MGVAQDRAKALRAELAVAEADAKAEARAQRKAEREARQAEAHRLAQEYREEKFTATVGEDSEYIALTDTYGGVEVAIVEWQSQQSSVTLSRDEVLALIEALQQTVK
jgi:hypothetical protein